MTSESFNDQDPMHQLLKTYTSALKTFTTSPTPFQILHTLGSPLTHFNSTSQSASRRTLYILDSSFNPPTQAHLRIATSALVHDKSPSASGTSASIPQTKRLLLLLAIQNADKAPKPASFEQRLVMMTIFAQDLLSTLPSSRPKEEEIGIDIALTKLPYFHEKAQAIEQSGDYGDDVEQVHLTGYDTLLRILDPKYYAPSHTLRPLHPFLAKHRLRVSYRADAEWGARAEQDAFLQRLAQGDLESVEGKREWVNEQRIVLVEGRRDGEPVVSSTKVREAVKRRDREALKELVTPSVAEWVLGEELYLQD